MYNADLLLGLGRPMPYTAPKGATTIAGVLLLLGRKVPMPGKPGSWAGGIGTVTGCVKRIR